MSAVLPPQPLLPPSADAAVPAKISAPLPSPFRGEERLNLSRERMRLWLETSRGGKQSQRLSDRARRSGWFASLRANPAAAAVFSLASSWWSRHPLRAVAALANGALRTSMRSKARQRPLAVITLGMVAGAVAVWARPWRWILRPAVFVGLMTQVVNRAIAEMPLESMLKMFTAFAGGGAKNRARAAEPGSRTTP